MRPGELRPDWLIAARATGAVLAVLIAAAVTWPSLASEYEPARTGPVTAARLDSGRIIVKFRGVPAGESLRSKVAAEQVAGLSGRTGVPLNLVRRIGGGLEAVEIGAPATTDSMRVNLELLRADPDVEFVEPDERRFPHAIPNDTLFPGQWHLQNAATTPSAVDAVGAWDLTTGSTGVVVAVVDTGVRYDHPDLAAAASGGRLLPGYDFIEDRDSANDGDGRDPDPSDPGDWVTAAEAGSPPFNGCPVADSSWHGTRLAGIVGALTNNSLGVAGLSWNGWILPARALGKCGGFDSDILAAMLWSGGAAVGGVPASPYPARVINLSLGSAGSNCPQTYRDVISRLASRGVLVVASVGNEGGAVATPANCPGVAGIAGIRHAGTKVGFSNLGPAVALSAPGGNCVNLGSAEPCLYSIDTTTNLGPKAPAANGYTDQFNFNVGTSFSAPIVSGIAGLMLAANGRLGPAQLIARLQEGATRPFPAASDPGVPVCHVPTGPGDLQTSECVCTTQTCGAGMANAAGAVRAALRPVAAIAVPASVSPGQDVVLRGTGSGAACNRVIASHAWTIVDGGSSPPGIVGAGTDTATVIAPSSGAFTVRLTVTDDAGRTDTADVVVSPNAAATAAPAAAGGPACPSPITVTAPVVVTVSPATVTLFAGTGSQAFVATLANTADSRVGWSVNDVPGGNATLGTITTSGTYTAPASPPIPATVTVTAVSVADPSRAGSATVTIVTRPPVNGGSGGGGGGSTGVLTLLLMILGVTLRRRQPGVELAAPVDG